MFHVKVYPVSVLPHHRDLAMLVLNVCVYVCVCVCVCVCVFARQGLIAAHLASQWTMEVQLGLGSAQMSLHSQVSWCVTLFPVTFSAINLQTYSDGVPLWGYIVFMSHHFLDGIEVMQPMRWRSDFWMKFGFNSISCKRRMMLSYWCFFISSKILNVAETLLALFF